MNPEDQIRLRDKWHEETCKLEGVMQASIKSAQDHAYELGVEHGSKEPDYFSSYFPHAKTWEDVYLAVEGLLDQRDALLSELKNASCALTSAGLIAEMQSADSAIHLCEELKKAA